MPVLISLDGALGGRRVACSTMAVDLAAAVANHAAIRGRISSMMLMNESLGAALSMRVEERAQVADVMRRHIAVGDEHVAGEVGGNALKRASRGVAGAALFGSCEREARARGTSRAASTSRA